MTIKGILDPRLLFLTDKLTNVTLSGPPSSSLFVCLFSVCPPFGTCLNNFWDLLRDISSCYALQWMPMARWLACKAKTIPLMSATGRHADLLFFHMFCI